jgi:hypothetical protein
MMASLDPNESGRGMRRRFSCTFVAARVAIAVAACGPASDGDGAARATAADSTALSASDSAAKDSVARARQDSINRAQPGYVIDSVRPVEEEIRRFQATLGAPLVAFGGGAPNRDALVQAFIDATERGNEAALRQLVVDRAEFAFLVYPTSPNTKPPYRLSPAIVWMQRSAGTDKSVTRLLQRFGGRPSGYLGYSCDDPPVVQGANRLWMGCVVRLRTAGGNPTELRLFGPIVERAGTYKFLSLTSGL